MTKSLPPPPTGGPVHLSFSSQYLLHDLPRVCGRCPGAAMETQAGPPHHRLPPPPHAVPHQWGIHHGSPPPARQTTAWEDPLYRYVGRLSQFELRCESLSIGSGVSTGSLYYLYMGLLAVFCTNSINILSGINGVEVGQSLLISLSVIVYLGVELVRGLCCTQQYLMSLCVLLPFFGTSLALFKHNK